VPEAFGTFRNSSRSTTDEIRIAARD